MNDEKIVQLRDNFCVRAAEIRELIERLGLSQRGAAALLGLPERDFRSWCAGRPCPRYVVLALQYLADERAPL